MFRNIEYHYKYIKNYCHSLINKNVILGKLQVVWEEGKTQCYWKIINFGIVTITPLHILLHQPILFMFLYQHT